MLTAFAGAKTFFSAALTDDNTSDVRLVLLVFLPYLFFEFRKFIG